ncbi:MAG: FAD:protein FMN transferase [archaeon]|nr:FAD:protein FMN transferase [archaeon]MCR4323799.1 FAD:protein FMN transferase [Nanoarchaeota archaeon]
MFKFSNQLFGANVDIFIYNIEEKEAKRIFKKIYEEGVRLERIFNFYDKESELSRLNKERRLKVSQEFLEVLRFSLDFCKWSGGLYDIALGKNFLERKSGKDLSKLGCSYKDIKINGAEVILTHEDLLIDFGSVAKGYITDKMGEDLEKNGIKDFVINSRGDVLVRGDSEHIVEIQNPRERKQTIGKVTIKNSGIATSGDYNQFFGEKNESHIIGETTYTSITVVAPSLREADSYATLLSVISKVDVEDLLDKKKELKVLTLDKMLKIKTYNNFDKIFKQEDDEVGDYFATKKLILEEERKREEEDSEEWFVEDGPLNDKASTIFVRPGRRDDEETITGAS